MRDLPEAGAVKRALALAALVAAALAAPARGAAEEAGAGIPLGLPTGAGGVRSGEGGSTRLEEEGPDVSAARMGVTQDFPEWLGKETGWWTPPSEAERKKQTRHVTIAPFITTSPQIGVGFGVAAAGTRQLGDPATTRLSKFATNLLITTESQYSVPLRTNINLPGGDWNLVGIWRWSKWPSPTWGIGGNTPDSAKATVDYQLLRFYEVVNRRIADNFFVGLGYRLDYYFNINAGPSAGGQPTDFSQYPYGTGSKSLNSSLALNLLFDSRDSPVFATQGVYANLSYAFTPKWLGSDTQWQTAYLDVRTYVHLLRPLVLGLWSYAWFDFGEVPYLELPSIGSDPDARSGRGFIEGRHIGKGLLYGEAEFRYTIWEWLGAVASVNVHSAAEPSATTTAGPPDEPTFSHWWPSFTVGARILAEKATHSNLCLDVAFAGDGEHGIYFNFTEVF